jgi:hypothetical protein
LVAGSTVFRTFRRRARHEKLAVACLALILAASTGRPDTITVNNFNNNTPATVTFNDGMGDSGSNSTNLTQWNVTYTAGGNSLTFNTFSVDLLHTVTVGQTYSINARNDLASAFANGSRIAYVFQSYGLPDLTSNPDQAAAVQTALWDLSLNNHNPTSFGPDGDGTYSSGDPDVFKVSFGSSPDASQIAALTNQYLMNSVGANNQGSWFDASQSGGENLLQPVPEPPTILLSTVAAVCISIGALRRRYRARHWSATDY